MWGTDQAASLSLDGMNMLCMSFDKIKNIVGDGIKKFSTKEKKMLSKFKYW
jgi:sialic acid synthase SpsE